MLFSERRTLPHVGGRIRRIPLTPPTFSRITDGRAGRMQRDALAEDEDTGVEVNETGNISKQLKQLFRVDMTSKGT